MDLFVPTAIFVALCAGFHFFDYLFLVPSFWAIQVLENRALAPLYYYLLFPPCNYLQVSAQDKPDPFLVIGLEVEVHVDNLCVSRRDVLYMLDYIVADLLDIQRYKRRVYCH